MFAVFLVVDNYDSFVFNLARMLRVAGATTEVVRNDAVDVDAVVSHPPEAIVLSPGPGAPADACPSLELVRRAGPDTPVLGVCLGHQVIVEAFGGHVCRAPEPLHGRTSEVSHRGDGLFARLPSPLTVCRYHSLAADPERLPAELRVTARADDGVVMAVAHRERPVWGVQFHPEAILTEAGDRVLANFVSAVTRARQKGAFVSPPSR